MRVKEESHRLQLIEQFADFTQRMKANLTNLKFEERRQIVRLLVEEVMVNTQTEEIAVRHILPLDQKFPLCKGSTDSALRCPAVRRVQDAPVHESGLQPLVENTLVHRNMGKQPRVRNLIEATFYIAFQDI